MGGREIAEHIAALRIEGERLAAAAGSAGPDAPVPSCPDWVARDLVRHLGGVHRWATGYVAGARTEQWDVDMDELSATYPGDDGWLGWFRDGLAALVDALGSASPDLECWTFLAAPSPLAFWARRQAHETAIHRVDAELAAGLEPSGSGAAFAADGIDELLTGFITRRKGGPAADATKALRVQCTDTDADWLVRVGPDGVTTVRHGGDGTCAVSGPASDLYVTLWNRRAASGLAVEGEEAVLAEFLQATRIRWS
jgi:uncharacterized protein (TIGR03083 family)